MVEPWGTQVPRRVVRVAAWVGAGAGVWAAACSVVGPVLQTLAATGYHEFPQRRRETATIRGRARSHLAGDENGTVTIDGGLASHWEALYASGDTKRSWFQAAPRFSLKMFAAAGVSASDSVIDVGGGASTLVDALVGCGFSDVTVLDISEASLRLAQKRSVADAGRVRWIVANLFAWQGQRQYNVWHDRAVFHFLTTDEDQTRYVDALNCATTSASVAVFGCFAPDGPQQCSRLPTARYDAEGLAAVLGEEWITIAKDREEHVTPAGAVQPFTWAAFRRRP